jgi:5'-nucleotidase
MRVLITNDDGIEAEGLRALRAAVAALDGVEVSVIAPNSNRSATARSITTRVPIWVEEVSFEDGGVGYATDGTPVDCVRFADLGLVGERPDLIVSGINHGANLGDDITYSGTVAAALEGIVLGIPAIAVSQQSAAREMGFLPGPRFDFDRAARVSARLVELLAAEPPPPGTLLNVNCPAGDLTGVEVTRLGKRVYEDELRLVEKDDAGRRRYRIYGFAPTFEEEPGTDLTAVAAGRVSVTPVHFDLTHHEGLDRLREARLETDLLAALEPTVEARPGAGA